jgi:hypothetical protein
VQENTRYTKTEVGPLHLARNVDLGGLFALCKKQTVDFVTLRRINTQQADVRPSINARVIRVGVFWTVISVGCPTSDTEATRIDLLVIWTASSSAVIDAASVSASLSISCSIRESG